MHPVNDRIIWDAQGPMDQAGPENRPRALFKLIEEACLDDEAVIVVIEVGAYIPISCRDVDCSASGDAEIDAQFTFVGGSVEPVCEALRAARRGAGWSWPWARPGSGSGSGRGRRRRRGSRSKGIIRFDGGSPRQ